jgi:hypothetical protein
MYDFILMQWLLKKLNKDNLQNCVDKGFISEEQMDVIISNIQFNAN